jgi:hypothetical protein
MFSGGKEHVNFIQSGGGLIVSPSAPSKQHGLKVAGPPTGAGENRLGYSGNSSGAAALASRTCHLIHDALENAYGVEFLQLERKFRSCLLKALLVHTASQAIETFNFIKSVMGPSDNKQHVKQKDNIRRFIGYGFANPDLAISCADDRATFWTVGEVSKDSRVEIQVPIPACIGAQALPHRISATLAWLTPVASGRQAYRSVRLNLLEPDDIQNLGVVVAKHQPDTNMGRRGTVFSRCWVGSRAAVVGDNHVQSFWVQREPDEEENVPVPFALAVTLAMPTVNQIYAQVRDRLAVAPPIRV